MLQLSALALDWGANLVETVVFQSFLFGIEGIYPHHHLSTINSSNTSALRLFEIYDSNLLNSHIHENLSPDVSMDSFDVFLRRAEREITLIHFATEQSTVPHIRRISPDSSLDLLAAKLAFRRHAYIANCSRPNLYGFTDLTKKIEHSLNSKAASLHRDDHDKSISQKKTLSTPFKITRVLCLNPKYTYTSDTLSKYISLPGTVIFTNWLGCCLNECTIHNVKETNDHTLSDDTIGDYYPISQWPLSHCNTSLRFSVPTRMSYTGRVRDAQLFHHSRIMYAAKRQLEYMGIDQKKGYVSIHIRIERIIRDVAESNFKLWPRNKLNFMEKCVEKILDRLQKLLTLIQAEKQNFLSKFLLITDISEYGTNSLTTSTLLNDAQLFLEILKSHGVQVHRCNLALLSDHDAHNSGYVSLVEMSMLALGQKLLLVGGGGFQINIAHKFYSLHGRKRDVLKESCSGL